MQETEKEMPSKSIKVLIMLTKLIVNVKEVLTYFELILMIVINFSSQDLFYSYLKALSESIPSFGGNAYYLINYSLLLTIWSGFSSLIFILSYFDYPIIKFLRNVDLSIRFAFRNLLLGVIMSILIFSYA